MKQLRADLAISEEIKWDDVSSQILTPGEKILEGKILFHKIEDGVVKAQIDKLKERSDQVEKEYEPVKENIPFDTFKSVDIRAARVVDADNIKKAKKIVKITDDLGLETRTIVYGIANKYTQ